MKAINEQGYEFSSLRPGWIKKKILRIFADDTLKDLLLFYVINTPCSDLSSSAIELNEYGWDKKVWKNEKLKKHLFEIAGIKRGSTFFVAKQTNQMKEMCRSANLGKGFQKSRKVQRIAIYKGKYNEFLSICYHIRNALAHGRLAMYKEEDDVTFVLEDGVKKDGKFQVRSRMILRKSTLKQWMEIIKSGRYPETLDTLQEQL